MNNKFIKISGNIGGSFWYGKQIGFPGFLYKKQIGSGIKKNTLMNPGANTYCNCKNNYDIFNKYSPGLNGVGSNSISVRRMKNRRATINKCFPNYMTLGIYNKSYNVNGKID